MAALLVEMESVVAFTDGVVRPRHFAGQGAKWRMALATNPPLASLRARLTPSMACAVAHLDMCARAVRAVRSTATGESSWPVSTNF